VLASPFVVGAGVGAAVLGAAYGGYRTGLAAYQGWTRNEVDPWTGAATGRTLTRAEQGAATGDFVAGGLTIGAGAAKAVAGRLGTTVQKTGPQWTQEVKTRPMPGRDGGVSTHVIERIDGQVNSVTHQVTRDGKIIHQHQTHIGKFGAEREFPSEWIRHPRVQE